MLENRWKELLVVSRRRKAEELTGRLKDKRDACLPTGWPKQREFQGRQARMMTSTLAIDRAHSPQAPHFPPERDARAKPNRDAQGFNFRKCMINRSSLCHEPGSDGRLISSSWPHHMRKTGFPKDVSFRVILFDRDNAMKSKQNTAGKSAETQGFGTNRRSST